ncbi:carbohydrate ABC transporter permease [Candidatus Sumerlaeota bacterium]|nr:carbohydrate ABC transporter permease [Candidatus Sumerlaeota bacterium]
MKDKALRRIFLCLGIVFISLFFLAPFLWMILISFSQSPDFPGGGAFSPTLKNFRDILEIKTLRFPAYLKNSLIISIMSSMIACIIGGLSAYGISRFRFRGKMIIVLGALALSMFPQISIVGYLFKFMSGIGWINTYKGLIFPYIAYSLPLALWILMSYFSRIPGEIDEAAQIDGASPWQIFTKVAVPVSLPGFLSAFLLLFMFAFNEFLFALLLTTDYRARTVPVGIALFQGLHGEIPWGYIMAASAVSCTPLILIAVFAQRYVIQGLTRGSLKG